jgi:hypothetical protein
MKSFLEEQESEAITRLLVMLSGVALAGCMVMAEVPKEYVPE